MSKNKLVPIDKYLANELSKGPAESKGNINYHYQHTINMYNFFTLMMLNKIKEFKIMCIPRFATKYGRYIDRNSTLIDLYNKKFYFPKKMVLAIQKCIKKGIRFIYFSLQIKSTKKWFTHMNIVLIDLKKNIRKI